MRPRSLGFLSLVIDSGFGFRTSGFHMSLLNDILKAAVTAKASDVHITVGSPPLFPEKVLFTTVSPVFCA